jgi:hypothetical protein
MDSLLKTALWQQFGATIDMLENALLACPDSLWRGRLWNDNSDHPPPPEYTAFWSIAHHTLFWLDFDLSGSPEGFAPPAPFTLAEFDPAGAVPERPHTREELHTYLVYLRKKCQTTIEGMSDERAHQQVALRKLMSFYEIQLYSMRHVQEHTAQLSLFLGQHGISSEALNWVPQAKGDKGEAGGL